MPTVEFVVMTWMEVRLKKSQSSFMKGFAMEIKVNFSGKKFL